MSGRSCHQVARTIVKRSWWQFIKKILENGKLALLRFHPLKIETSKITNILDLIRANAHIQIVNQAKLYVYMNLFGRDIKFPEFEVDDTRDGVEACSINIRANLHLLNKELINSPPLQWFRGLFFVIFFVFFLFWNEPKKMQKVCRKTDLNPDRKNEPYLWPQNPYH